MQKRISNPAASANLDKKYRPAMRFAGSRKNLTPDFQHNINLAEKLREKYGFGDAYNYDISEIGDNHELVVEYYRYMLAETGHSIGYNANKQMLTNDGLCYVDPRKIAILLEECDFFDDQDDFTEKSMKYAVRRCSGCA
eukprot:360435-Prymnesium_polylepis.1